MTDTNKTRFKAVLTPNRSLSRKGFVLLMAVFGTISFSAGIFFATLGAWPVFGFFGLDVALLYWAFNRNFADGELRELVEVTDSEVILRRFQPRKPEQEHRFIRHWVRLELFEDSARELVGSLIVHSHGKRIEIGAFLSPDERKEFYGALRQALTS